MLVQSLDACILYYKFKCYRLLESNSLQLAHIVPLHLHGGMDIPVKRDGRVGVSQNLRKRLDLKAHFHGAGCKRVAKRMEMHAFQPTVPGVFLHTVLQRPGFHIRIRAGKNIGRRTAGVHFPAELGRVSRHGNRSYGGIALW